MSTANKEEAIKSLYGDAATKSAGLCCPQIYQKDLTEHIPEEALERNYGCGSPLLKANVKNGETIVDLGSGVGIDSFVAAKLVGPNGKAIGVDMTDDMLEQANIFKQKVADNIGYDVVEFRKGYIEDLPIEDSSVDLVISNCVLNLSSSKEKVLSEILRVLKPGGRMIISDIVVDREVDQEDKDNEQLWAECYTGAIPVGALVSTYQSVGFEALTQIDESSWKELNGYNFGSITLCVYKLPPVSDCNYGGHVAVYMGPYSSVTDEDGHVFKRFEAAEVCDDTANKLRLQPYNESFQVIDIPSLAREATSCGTGSSCGTGDSANSNRRESPCCDPSDKAAPCCDNNEPKDDGSPCCDPLSIEQSGDCGCTAEQLAIPEAKVETAPASSGCCDSGSSCGTGSSCGEPVTTSAASASAVAEECCPCDTEAKNTGGECCDTGCGECGCQ